jgi:hypothetical protein
MPDNNRPSKPDDATSAAAAKGAGPRKGRRPPARRSIAGQTVLKPKTAPGAGSATRRGEGAEMAELTEQQARPRSAEPAGRYVRVRVRVENDQMSIIDSHLVESALVMPRVLQGSHVYEVTDGTRVLHAEAIPDLGVVRSFADPDPAAPPELRRHHSYQLPVLEFDARVPAQHLTARTLGEISVVLYRMKQQPSTPVRSEERLGVQFENELREVARIDGIPAKLLPAGLRARSSRRAQRER